MSLARFRDQIKATSLADLHADLIGHGRTIDGPFGPRPLIYADYVASGRPLGAVERFVMEEVLPWYANSHTEASHCGGTMTRLRRSARAEIARITGAGPEHAVIFTGSGATAGINRLVHLLNVGPGTTVIIGPYEHHSNILPWRESGAEVIALPEAEDGSGPCLAALDRALAKEGPKVVALSAASNVTGITSDVAGITARAKAAGARVVWDFAGGAPYMALDMGAGMDAVVISPHKFVGGPGASGLLIIRRDATQATRPTLPGGGTVRFVSSEGHDYSQNLEAREEGGTPNVIGDIRAALALIVKEAVGQDVIDARQQAGLAKARARLAGHPRIVMLDDRDVPRLPILSFRVRDGQGSFIHQQLATRMLSDLYGVQARGGCACAGPYVLKLLGADAAAAASMRAAILSGAELEKPGFVRLNLCWLAPDQEVDAILDAICDLAERAPALTARYSGDPTTAIFTPLAA
ncbi:aminotransferase class V-fold PLP-dependent enzyme [Paracoccus suum]|uniref:Aminotransferase class V-fold PLP-dependent enzyme n=1 Tax=Paracoccus suum TaxID=2259340 RepID=A0A344PIJ3_9RHOB|nr:aminotransferase class V-fold PLP-dependent enzyme [Paracoccus suum]AXC49198.1 aminotransferase class V-fold PLP-dependent enzyme [Paracoccus suum]